MFSRISRYRNVPDIVISAIRGRKILSKALRLLPNVTGQFLHTIEETDRLDHVAFKYYRQSKNWWRICDANPEFLSPRGLLGKEPTVTSDFSLFWTGPIPPWSGLREELNRSVGVDEVVLGTPEAPLPSLELAGETLLLSISAALQGELDASVLAQELTAPLETALASEALTFAGAVRVESINSQTWQLSDLATNQTYILRLDGGSLNTFAATMVHHWVVRVTYGENVTPATVLQGVMLALGFDAPTEQPIGRVGKPIVIPPNASR